jgi:hypothetical protein
MEAVRLGSYQEPNIRQSDQIGTGQHYEVQDEDIARLLFSDDSYFGDVCTYTSCEHYMLSLHELEFQLATWIACAGEAQDLLTLVQLWLITASRLGYNRLCSDVLRRYDAFVAVLEHATGCVTQCDLLACYQILSHRHKTLEQARVNLTMELLTVSSKGGGDQKCGTMFCGSHQSYTCPNDESFSRDWQISLGGASVYDDITWRQFASPVFFRDLQAEVSTQFEFVEGRYLEPSIRFVGSAPRRVGPSDIYWNFREGFSGDGVAQGELKVQTCCYNCADKVSSHKRLLHI